MLTRSPTRCTPPSTTAATPSSCAISPRLLSAFLYRMLDVREVTLRSAIFARCVMMASVIPSEKYSFSGSALILMNGSTATVALSTRGPPLDSPYTKYQLVVTTPQSASASTPPESAFRQLKRRRAPATSCGLASVPSAAAGTSVGSCRLVGEMPSWTNAVARTIGRPSRSRTMAKAGNHCGRLNPDVSASTTS